MVTQESSLLLTLEEISQLVSHSHNPRETLANIVRLIQGRFHTDVCSVYLLEPEHGELVLGATVGLKPENIGQVRMRLNEGLTGLVAEKMAPVMVDDAFRHPRFKYFPELGEDPYHSFLGVPLVEGGLVQGVLVVQTREPRVFSANEVRLLITVAAQLAPLVGEARLLEQVAAFAHESPACPPEPQEPTCPSALRGRALSPGVGVGRAYIVNGFDDWIRHVPTHSSDPEHEHRRLARALEGAREEISRLSQRISELVGEDHGAILQAQFMIMQDGTIEQDLTGCLNAGKSAEGALLQTLDKYVAAFQKVSSAYFQERVADVKDVFRRILWHLQPAAAAAGPSGGRLVLLSREASVLDLFSVDLGSLAAVVVEHGGAQSHAAILARSLGIPMVSQVPEFVTHLQPGRELLVNGTVGMVYLDPTPELMATVKPSAQAVPASTEEEAGAERTGLPRVEANINLLCEVKPAMEQRVGGVGLYRSEFLFLARRTLPTEDEQLGIYRKLLTALKGRPASIRTFDLRPDKLAHCSPLVASSPWPLDWRLVLDSPPLQKLFKDQVRAILRAATAGPARLLVPLVTRTEQLDFVLQTVGQAREDLRREGLEFGEDVPLGVMIEVAAAALMAETWVEHVDFFALGTNDLVASALGISRDDPVGASRNDPLHPGVLRLIHHIVGVTHEAGRRVTVCGEMAADPEGIVALAALGVDSVSVPVNQLAAARRYLAERSAKELMELGPALLALRYAGEARDLLQQELVEVR